MMSARGKRERHIRELAVEGFARHKIECRLFNGLFRQYRCQRPGSWTYGFDITLFPGHLVCAGDVGDGMVSRCADMLHWCRSAVGSTEYFQEKIPRVMQTEEHDWECVKEWFADEKKELLGERKQGYLDRDEARLRWDRIKEAIEDVFEDDAPSMVYEKTSEIWNGCDPPNFRNYTYDFLWFRECVRFLVERVDEDGIILPEWRREFNVDEIDCCSH